MTEIDVTANWFFQQSQNHRQAPALKQHDSSLNYSSLMTECLIAAKHFVAHGIKPNDNIALWFSHSPDFWICVNALWLIGAVPVPINTRLTKEELKSQFVFSDSKFLITNRDDTFLVEFPQIIFKWQSKSPEANAIYSSQSIPELKSSFNKDKHALIMFTSGSSGKPKGVIHTFRSLAASVEATNLRFNLSSRDIWLAALPFYHIGGFMILLRALLSGASVYIPESLDHDRIKESLEKSGCTHISLVSTTLQRLLNEDATVPPNLKCLFLGGGFAADSLCVTAANLGWPVIKVYGSTETCSMVTALNPEEIPRKTSSVGKVLDPEQIKIIIKNFHNNREASADETGEILIYSKSLFTGYLKNKELTEEKLREGIYNTGDSGRLDESDYLYIEARRKDLIITGGENVSAVEVEDVLKSVEGVSDAFCFGKTDEKWGHIVCAAVVTAMPEESLRTELRNKLAGYKIPKRFYFIDELPRTELGKVNREKLFSLIKAD